MFRSFRNFLTDLGGRHPSRTFGHDDYRVAAAALLLHAVHADGLNNPAEQALVNKMVRESFGLDERSAADLLNEADQRDRETSDLSDLTSVLRRELDPAGRARVVEMLWRVSLADGHIDELEENLVHRVADLLGVPARDRMNARINAGAPPVGAGAGDGD